MRPVPPASASTGPRRRPASPCRSSPPRKTPRGRRRSRQDRPQGRRAAAAPAGGRAPSPPISVPPPRLRSGPRPDPRPRAAARRSDARPPPRQQAAAALRAPLGPGTQHLDGRPSALALSGQRLRGSRRPSLPISTAWRPSTPWPRGRPPSMSSSAGWPAIPASVRPSLACAAFAASTPSRPSSCTSRSTTGRASAGPASWPPGSGSPPPWRSPARARTSGPIAKTGSGYARRILVEAAQPRRQAALPLGRAGRRSPTSRPPCVPSPGAPSSASTG